MHNHEVLREIIISDVRLLEVYELMKAYVAEGALFKFIYSKQYIFSLIRGLMYIIP